MLHQAAHASRAGLVVLAQIAGRLRAACAIAARPSRNLLTDPRLASSSRWLKLIGRPAPAAAAPAPLPASFLAVNDHGSTSTPTCWLGPSFSHHSRSVSWRCAALRRRAPRFLVHEPERRVPALRAVDRPAVTRSRARARSGGRLPPDSRRLSPPPALLFDGLGSGECRDDPLGAILVVPRGSPAPCAWPPRSHPHSAMPHHGQHQHSDRHAVEDPAQHDPTLTCCGRCSARSRALHLVAFVVAAACASPSAARRRRSGSARWRSCRLVRGIFTPTKRSRYSPELR